jgi:hypothetical protein
MESRDDDELPWDPLWAYVLGEDENDSIIVVADRRDTDKQPQEQQPLVRSIVGRPVASPKGLGGFWQKDNHSKEANQGWAWELDPAIFSSASNSSSRPRPPANDEMVTVAASNKEEKSKDQTERWQWELDPAFFTCGTDSTVVSDSPSNGLPRAEAMKRTVSRILPFGSKQK